MLKLLQALAERGAALVQCIGPRSELHGHESRVVVELVLDAGAQSAAQGVAHAETGKSGHLGSSVGRRGGTQSRLTVKEPDNNGRRR